MNTTGVALLLAGIVLLASGFFPMVTITIDTTPPSITAASLTDGALYYSVSEIWVKCKDPETDIKSATVQIDSTTYTLSYNMTFPQTGEQIWRYAVSLPLGSHTFRYTVTNYAGLSATRSGSFTIGSDLAGTWYINDIQITSSSQRLNLSTTTLSEKFVKTAGPPDSQVSCAVKQGSADGQVLLGLTNTAAGTWTGTMSLGPGTYTLALVAADGIKTVTMSIVQMDIPGFVLPELNTLQVIGAALMLTGAFLCYRKPD